MFIGRKNYVPYQKYSGQNELIFSFKTIYTNEYSVFLIDLDNRK